jgi:hypothetical protein
MNNNRKLTASLANRVGALRVMALSTAEGILHTARLEGRDTLSDQEGRASTACVDVIKMLDTVMNELAEPEHQPEGDVQP